MKCMEAMPHEGKTLVHTLRVPAPCGTLALRFADYNCNKGNDDCDVRAYVQLRQRKRDALLSCGPQEVVIRGVLVVVFLAWPVRRNEPQGD